MSFKSNFLKLVRKKNRYQSPLDFNELKPEFIEAIKKTPDVCKNNYCIIEGFIRLYGYESEKSDYPKFSILSVGLLNDTGQITLYEIHRLLPKLIEYKDETD